MTQSGSATYAWTRQSATRAPDPGGRLLTDDQIAETMAVERRDAGEVEQELGAALIGEIPDPARHIRTDVTQTLGTEFQDHDVTDEPLRLALHSSTYLADSQTRSPILPRFRVE